MPLIGNCTTVLARINRNEVRDTDRRSTSQAHEPTENFGQTDQQSNLTTTKKKNETAHDRGAPLFFLQGSSFWELPTPFFPYF